jgi:hypothetical protein
MYQHPEARLILKWRINNMSNNLKHQKSIEAIRKEFHIVAKNPPKYNPFTSEGNQVWDNWTDRCRGYEVELKEAGEYF